ncbi:Dihydrolipoamide dehydrogenase [hydrothermal vent metagenome]|uniref:Dihydrolipoamide dehydrogenase n=1 Tax=hydrothermal vent metagenome TaxID=652676 RepID=A0A3B0ZSE7_9ZZZZ
MDKQYDILVIGGGPGGTPAALALAQAGKKVLLVEAGGGLGGTCLFEGCIPSKIFRETAHRLRDVNRAAEFGIQLPTELVHLDWHRVQARKQEILQRRSGAAVKKVAQFKTLDLLFGHARLQGPRQAEIQPHEGDAFMLRFEQCILATGSRPNRLPLRGVDLPQVYSSDAILDIECIPEHLTVIGGGPIGVELAQVFHALGASVTLLERGPRILQGVDEELVGILERQLIEQGITLHRNASVKSINHTGKGVFVQYDLAEGGYDQTFATVVLMAAGRHAHIDGLGLEATAINASPHGIEVDETLQTTEPGIYAVGDVAGQPMFAHWATAQGLALARHLLGQPAPFPQVTHNSAVIFSTPELAMAGLTETQARAAGMEVAVARYDFSQDARAQISGDDSGILKIVYKTSDRKIIGVHALVEGAADLMGEAALLVRTGLPLEAVVGAIHPHPTLTESFAVAVRSVLADVAEQRSLAGHH